MALLDILKLFLGNKSDRDIKKLQPLVNKTLQIHEELKPLTNDELRARTAQIREELSQSVADYKEEIATIKQEIEGLDYDKREPLWDKIDNLEGKILDTLEEKLDEALPTVFAIVKETARRFAENETIEVTATQMDRDLAAEGRDFLSIDGDKAIYYNHWEAGGNETVWNMIHYDVQLIGGAVLHQGKIAEMATG